jgi:hypothetical protein
VRGYVSFEALDATFQELKIVKAISSEELSKCSGKYTKSLGLPCKHIIKKKLDIKESLQLGDFDTAYHLRFFDGEEACRLTLPPIQLPGRQ